MGMKGPVCSILLAAALLPGGAAAAEQAVRPLPDIFLFASPDPLTQSVLRTQVSDGKSGGVVSAVLHQAGKGALAAGRPAHVEYQGSGTPADSLKLPAAVIARGAAAASPVSDLRDAVASKPVKAAAGRRFIKRSIAADQLFSVVEAMQRQQEKAAADKVWDRTSKSRRR